jgi:hypothetical protein
MSRLRGDRITEQDWKLWRRFKPRYICGDKLIPRRIVRRLDLCGYENHHRVWSNFASGGFAMPARVLAQPPTGDAYVFNPVDQAVDSDQSQKQ